MPILCVQQIIMWNGLFCHALIIDTGKTSVVIMKYLYAWIVRRHHNVQVLLRLNADIPLSSVWFWTEDILRIERAVIPYM